MRNNGLTVVMRLLFDEWKPNTDGNVQYPTENVQCPSAALLNFCYNQGIKIKHRTQATSYLDIGHSRLDICLPAGWIFHAYTLPPALAVLYRYFCMSQAAVGQRSAHSPQWRHTFSSLIMTRLVLSSSET
jgi:hypothetical protein